MEFSSVVLEFNRENVVSVGQKSTRNFLRLQPALPQSYSEYALQSAFDFGGSQHCSRNLSKLSRLDVELSISIIHHVIQLFNLFPLSNAAAR